MTFWILIITLVIAGIILYAVNTIVPMQPQIKKILNILVVVVLAVITIVWLLGFLGVDIHREIGSPRHR